MEDPPNAMTRVRRQPRAAATLAKQFVLGETLLQRLFLLRFLHAEFGFRPDGGHDLTGDAATRALLSTMKGRAEGYRPDGVSSVASTLIDIDRKVISADDIRRYDANVRSHLFRINERRSEPLTLRYFQTLALIYAERGLDRLDKGP